MEKGPTKEKRSVKILMLVVLSFLNPADPGFTSKITAIHATSLSQISLI